MVEAGISFPKQTQDIDIPLEDHALVIIKSITANSGKWKTGISNNFPFPVNINISLNNGDNTLYETGDSFDNILPYNSEYDSSMITNNEPTNIIIDDGLSVSIDAEVPKDQSPLQKCEIYHCVGSTDYYADPNCENQCDLLSPCLSLDGWPIEGETTSVDIIFDLEFSNIISLSYEFLGIVQSKTINAPIPGFGGIEIKKAIISNTTSPDTNKLSLDIKNNSPSGLTLQFDFLNFYKKMSDGTRYQQ